MRRLTAQRLERLLGVVLGVTIILDSVVLKHKSVGTAVCASIGLAALLGAIAIGARRWWRGRNDPERPNYDRTPYV